MKNCLTPQIYENVRPHSSNCVENSQSSRENTTPFSSTSPLASYKEVPTHPGHYPNLGSDMLSAWISVLVAQTSFHRKTVVALQNVSWFQAIPHHVNILLVSSSSLWTAPPDVIFYSTIFNLYFLSSVLKMPCEYHFVLYIFLNTGSFTDTALNPPDWTYRQHRWSHKRVQRNKRPSGMRSFLPMIHYVLVVKLHVT